MSDKPHDVVEDETRQLRRLQRTVDRVEATLRRGGLSEAEQQALIADAREKCRQLFPDKLDVFELIYVPRFERAMAAARSGSAA